MLPKISRCAIQSSQPAAEVLKKIADALDSTLDFLISGNTEDKVRAFLVDAAVIRYFKEVDNYPLMISLPLSGLLPALSVM